MMMMDTLDASSSTASASQPMDVVPAVALAATTVVDFTATMVNMAATAESNNNHIVEMISSSEYKEHRKNKKKKREKREKDKEHRHHKHRREHRRDRDRDRDRDHHHHHHGNSHNSSQHSTSASSSPSSASTTPSATIEYVGGSASASPSYLGGGGSVSAAASGASNSSNSTATTYPHNLKIRFLLSGQRTELSPPTHQSSATAEVNATLAPATCAAISTTSATGSSSSSGSTTTANTSSSNIASGSTATIGSNNNATTGSAGLPPSNFAKADLSKTIGSGTKHGTNGGIKDTSSTSGSSSSSSSGNQQQATGANTNAPSLYVSVPLSTANVPGINLPNASGSVTGNGTGTSIDSSQSAIRSGSTTALSNPSLSNQQNQSSLGTTGSAAYVTPHTANSLSGIPTTSASSSASSSSLSALSSSVIQHQHPSGKSLTSASALSGGTSGALVSGNCGGNIISSTSTSTTTHSSGNLTATTTESGNLKISYEKQTNRVQQLQEQESSPGRRSRTPDLNSGTVSTSAISAASGNSNPNSSSFGGLKFTYEAQSQLDVAMLPVSSIKDSPPSSPGSEIGVNPHPAIANQPPAVNTASAAVGGNVRKRGRKAKDSTLATQAAAQAVADLKDVRILQNGGNNSSTASNSATTIGSPLVPAPTPPATPSISVNASSSSASASTSIIAHTATHMLGNHVNPNSSVAQKLSEQLHMEVQDHAIYTPDSMNSQFTGVPFPGKQRNSTTSSSSGNIASTLVAPNPLQSMFGGGGINGNMPIPQSLEQLLERQWEQGSQFLMEQAQHFDIASLLNCLHQLQSENLRLEEHVTSLIARRDHLLAVNARLQIPLSTISNNAKAEAHASGGNNSSNISSALNAATTIAAAVSLATTAINTSTPTGNSRATVAPASSSGVVLDYRGSSGNNNNNNNNSNCINSASASGNTPTGGSSSTPSSGSQSTGMSIGSMAMSNVTNFALRHLASTHATYNNAGSNSSSSQAQQQNAVAPATIGRGGSAVTATTGTATTTTAVTTLMPFGSVVINHIGSGGPGHNNLNNNNSNPQHQHHHNRVNLDDLNSTTSSSSSTSYGTHHASLYNHNNTHQQSQLRRDDNLAKTS